MRKLEILGIINEQRNESHCFVKWWRKENDFLDYDLIETFMENLRSDEYIEGIELLTMDDMWIELKRIDGSRLKLENKAAGEKVIWEHKGKSGVKTQSCDFTPKTLMTIFDVETRGNPVA
jgi:hypothetical protein